MRRRNLIREEELPYPIGGLVPYENETAYDTGDYHATLDACLSTFKWDEKRHLQGRTIGVIPADREAGKSCPPTSRPMLWAKFAPMPQKPPIARPARKAPAAARGDTRTRSLNATHSCSTWAGG